MHRFTIKMAVCEINRYPAPLETLHCNVSTTIRPPQLKQKKRPKERFYISNSIFIKQ